MQLSVLRAALFAALLPCLAAFGCADAALLVVDSERPLPKGTDTLAITLLGPSGLAFEQHIPLRSDARLPLTVALARGETFRGEVWVDVVAEADGVAVAHGLGLIDLDAAEELHLLLAPVPERDPLVGPRSRFFPGDALELRQPLPGDKPADLPLPEDGAPPPAAGDPPTDDPPADAPPADDPPVVDPPTDDPPVVDPPAEPPVTEPDPEPATPTLAYCTAPVATELHRVTRSYSRVHITMAVSELIVVADDDLTDIVFEGTAMPFVDEGGSVLEVSELSPGTLLLRVPADIDIEVTTSGASCVTGSRADVDVQSSGAIEVHAYYGDDPRLSLQTSFAPIRVSVADGEGTVVSGNAGSIDAGGAAWDGETLGGGEVNGRVDVQTGSVLELRTRAP